MNTAPRIACAFALALVGCAKGGDASPGLRAPERFVARAVPMAQVVRVGFALEAGARVRFETRQPWGMRPVLHLWDRVAGAEVAAARAWPLGLRGAVLEYRNASAAARELEL